MLKEPWMRDKMAKKGKKLAKTTASAAKPPAELDDDGPSSGPVGLRGAGDPGKYDAMNVAGSDTDAGAAQIPPKMGNSPKPTNPMPGKAKAGKAKGKKGKSHYRSLAKELVSPGGKKFID